jgi:hypothetical protein
MTDAIPPGRFVDHRVMMRPRSRTRVRASLYEIAPDAAAAEN